MRVRCIDNRAFLREENGALVYGTHKDAVVDLTKGKVYEVVAIERGWYRIVDDTDEDYLYPPELFEIVDRTPLAVIRGGRDQS